MGFVFLPLPPILSTNSVIQIEPLTWMIASLQLNIAFLLKTTWYINVTKTEYINVVATLADSFGSSP